MSNVVTLLSIKFPLIIISKNLWKSTDPNLVTFNQNNREKNREKNRKKIKSNITTEIEYKTDLQKEKAQLKYQKIDKSNKKKRKDKISQVLILLTFQSNLFG